MTLVEVMAGLALMGVLVGAMVVARGRLLGKAVEAECKAAAVKVLDGLVSEWWGQGGESFPRAGKGERDGWRWEISPVANPGVAAIGGSVVRVEVADAQGVGASVELAVAAEGGKRARAK